VKDVERRAGGSTNTPKSLRGRLRPLARLGAHALYFADTEIVVTTARAEQGRRPWVIVPTARKKLSFPPRPAFWQEERK